MIPVYSDEQFNQSTKSDRLPVRCEFCKNTFLVVKKEIERIMRGDRIYMFKFCSRKCLGANKTKDKYIKLNCKQCDKEITRRKREAEKYKNQFCSCECSGIYNAAHKVKGTRVSKLEIWLQENLLNLYPDMEMKFNDRETINSELDIYIPSLNLAFELNGIFHYEPIYGADKLKKIQNNDDRKFQACLEKDIELVIMDVSSINYWKPKKGEKYLDIIIEIINRKVPR